MNDLERGLHPVEDLFGDKWPLLTDEFKATLSPTMTMDAVEALLAYWRVRRRQVFVDQRPHYGEGRMGRQL